MQFLSRLENREAIEAALGAEGVQLPRDNPVKDFLSSANEKFRSFKDADSDFYGVLVIVWDDYVNEPITALLGPSSGLFTPSSFAKDSDGGTLNFQCVDAVVLIRQQHQFRVAAKNAPLYDGRSHAMDFGEPGSFPFNIYVLNPAGRQPPEEIFKALQAVERDDRLGGEYAVADLVPWYSVPSVPMDAPGIMPGRAMYGVDDDSSGKGTVGGVTLR